MTQKVAILGTGLMGTAIAELYLAEGYEVTVWNRTLGKSDELAKRGAKVSPSIADLLDENQLIFASLVNHKVLTDLLTENKKFLRGRDIINLITGTPDEAQSANTLVQENGGCYLDGAIGGYPCDIGEDRTIIHYAGPSALWEKYHAVLLKAGGASRWVGEYVGSANILDTAMAGAFGVSCVGAFVEAAHYADKSGVDIRELEGCVDYFLSAVKGEISSVITALSSKNFATDQAPLSVYVSALKTWRQSMFDAGASALIASAHLEALERAVSAGRGDLHIAATYAIPGQKT
jgi:3-hydroxyisobutyrate dehydrogenase-like beta-hydroxyacid dehydrogenase